MVVDTNNLKILRILLIVLSLFIVASCGSSSSSSDDDDAPQTSTLSGTAARGAPVVGSILVTGILGMTATADIDAAGNFNVDVTGLTPPYIIAAIPTDPGEETLYSFASQSNVTVNITPMTTLALYNANGMQDLSDLLDNWSDLLDPITQQDIDDAIAIINANFQNLYTNAGLDSAFDPFGDLFNADGAGFDAILDAITITFDPNGNTFSVTVDGQPGFDFDINIEIPDNGSGGLEGTWSLTISGTVDGNAIPQSTVNNLPAAAVPTDNSTGGAEDVFNNLFGNLGTVSNFSLEITSSSDTEVVVTASGTVSFEEPINLTQNYNLVYTYTQQ